MRSSRAATTADAEGVIGQVCAQTDGIRLVAWRSRPGGPVRIGHLTLTNGLYIAFAAQMAFDRRAVSLAQNVVQSTWPLVHDAVLWRQLADFPVNFMAKGRPVYVEGRLQTRTWDAADGTKRRTVEVVADRFQALSSRRTAEAA